MNGPINNDYPQEYLNLYNYTVYPNGTLSNGTRCYLSFGSFQPTLFGNGTVTNGTDCDHPYFGIGARGALGLAWAVFMFVSIAFSAFNLRKHGTEFLPRVKHFFFRSRRFQWYWLIVLQLVSTVAGFCAIDYDRAYIQGSASNIAAVFSTLVPIVSLPVVWELTRHWAVFEQRKLSEEDVYRFSNKQARANIIVGTAIAFYLFLFLSFMLTVIRSWTDLYGPEGFGPYAVGITGETTGRSVFSAASLTRIPSFFNTAWKVGVFFLLPSVVIIPVFVVYARYCYDKPAVPVVIVVGIVLVGMLVGYAIGGTYHPEVSPLNPWVELGFLSCFLHLPSALLVVLLNVDGILRENEDRILMRLRFLRRRKENPETYAAFVGAPQQVPEQETSAEAQYQKLMHPRGFIPGWVRLTYTGEAVRGAAIGGNKRYMPFRWWRRGSSDGSHVVVTENGVKRKGRGSKSGSTGRKKRQQAASQLTEEQTQEIWLDEYDLAAINMGVRPDAPLERPPSYKSVGTK